MTIKFVEADSESEASSIAAARTKLLMKQKGFGDSEIESFEFTTEEIDRFDRDEAEFDAERSFIYYSDN